MKLTMICGVASVALLASAVATAQAAETGFYAGAGLGYTYISNADDVLKDDSFKSNDITDKAFAWKALAGFQVDPMFAVEAAFSQPGKFKNKFVNDQNVAGEGKAKSDVFSLAVVGTAPLDQSMSVFGKVGGYYAKTHFDGTVESYSENNYNFMGGLGLSFDINANLSVRGEYEYYHNLGKYDNSTNGKFDGMNSHVFSASVVYAF